MNALPYSPASDRNKAPILQALEQLLPDRGSILEIGSGSGQHAVFIAPRFPGLDWQPSELHENMQGLTDRISLEGTDNIQTPVELDVLDRWPEKRFEAAFSANTSHIMSWEAVCGMFQGVGRLLLAEGLFCLYGPFNRGGQFTASSNRDFDASLRARDPQMGLRDLEALESLGHSHQLEKQMEIEMPANNMMLVFRKR